MMINVKYWKMEDADAQKNPDPDAPKEHHILDEIEKKYMSRAEQDAPFGLKGKGRKKRKEEDGNGGVEVKPKSKKGRGQKDGEDGDQGEPAAPQTKKPRQPRGKKSEKGAVDQGKSAASQPKKPRQPRGKKSETGDGDVDQEEPAASQPKKPRQPRKKKSEESTPKPKASAKAKALAKAKASSSKAKKTGKQEIGEEPKRRTRRSKVSQPVFKTCSVVPYWSRNAVALKVNTGKGKSGMTQAGLRVFWGCMYNYTELLGPLATLL